MSFYDDASLVFLPSGGAGKDGKAYSIKPVPEYGTNLVTNGGFDTDTDWVKGAGWTISGGTANCDGSSNILRQSNAVPLNTKLYVSIEVSNYVSGALQVKFAPVGYPLNVTKNGIYTIVTNGDNSLNTDLQIVSTAFIGSIDNVSVKEVIVEDGDFTFSRGSNLTATRVDSNGLIEKGRENLLLQSNQFDTTWATSNASVTSGQGGYDGSSDAWLLENVAGSAAYVLQNKVVNGVQTASVYAKSGTVDYIYLRLGGSSSRGLYVNLSNGTIYSTFGTLIDYNVDSVGNGWYRISVTYEGNHSNFRIYPSASGSTSTSLGDNIYIQDAQLEIGLTSTEYIESGASSGKGGLLENEPRFDYSGGASCPSLLLEPSRTNLVTSEYFDGWNLFTSMTPTANNATSPEGLQNAYKMETTAVSAYFRDAQTLTAGDNVFSIFAKRGNSQYIFLRTRFFTGGDNADVWFDVQNGTKGGNLGDSVTYDIEDYGNGWYRCYLVHNVDAADLFGYVYVGLTNTDEDTTGESGLNGYFYGGQWEEGSYLTSYIPNHSGGSETRDADVTSVTSVSSLIGQTEGTIYCEFEYNGAADSGVFNRIISIGTGVTQNRILLAKNDTTAELVAFAVSGGTTQVFQAISGTSIIGHHKVAISYKANEYKVYLDGELEFTDSSASVPATTDVYVGTAEDGTTDNELGGVVKQSIIFKEVLSEDNCKALTTI